MKKQRRICFLAALAATGICACCLPKTVKTVSASETKYTVEYTEKGVTLPLLHLKEGQSYQVEVFKASDTGYTTPLEKKTAYTFVAEEIGDYLLRYLINDNGIEKYEYATLTITDSTSPEISLNLQSVYKTGETLALRPVITDNTAALATVEYQLIINGKNASGSIKNDALNLTQGGEYKLQVSVTDGGGNTTKKLYTFTVEQGEVVETNSSSEKEETGGCSGTVGIGSAFVFGGIALAAFMKKGKEDEE